MQLFDARTGQCVYSSSGGLDLPSSRRAHLALVLPHLPPGSLSLSRRHVTSVPSKKYGTHLARFTHTKSTMIHASTKENGAHPLKRRRSCAR